MGKLIELYDWLSQEGVFVFDRQLPFSDEKTKALTVKLERTNTWGIFIDAGRMDTDAERAASIYHEGGHYATGTTHEVCSPQDIIEKHEYKADKWAVQAAVSKEDLAIARAAGHREIYDLAEYFGLTESFILKVVCWYDHGNLDVDLYYPDAIREDSKGVAFS